MIKKDKILKERKTRSVRSCLSTQLKQKHKESQRDKTLHSIRKNQEQTQDREINMLDFLFNFGGLC
jgi:hypothetical protein